MNTITQYRKQLEKMADRIRKMTNTLEDQTRMATGGDAGGNLSNTPMHLGDLGSEAYSQEIGAALLENEEYLLEEINAALERIERKTYGKCELCGKAIAAARLEAVPYTRHCIACAKLENDGLATNLNTGRPRADADKLAPPPGMPGDDRAAFTKMRPLNGRARPDTHAAGTAGGGTALGGLAGTNVGGGDPTDELDAAMGSSQFDVNLDSNDDPTTAYSGPAGGAVGGTPAGKRTRGGKRETPAKKPARKPRTKK